MFNISIDGYAGSGKSTVARIIAEKLNFHLLNTGEIYRSLTCAYLKENLGEPNNEKLEKFLKDKKFRIEFVDKSQFVYVNDVCYKEMLRKEQVSVMTAKLSPFKVVRQSILDLQRDFAKQYDCVMEGRDIGTVVLPDADIKFFLTASREVRAKRRFEQNKFKDENITFDSVMEVLKLRDYKDETREISPLKPAKDSIIIDNSNMTIEETVEKCLHIISKKIKVQK